MKPRFVLLTLGKELRETVRDRRTLAVMVLFPLVVYPLLALLGSQVVARRERGQAARPSQVAVQGSGALAEEVRGRLDRAKDLYQRRASGSAPEVDLGKLDALVVVSGPKAAGGAEGQAEVVFDATRDESRRAEERLGKTLGEMFPAGCLPRLDVQRRDLAPAARMGGYLLSKALPLMILLMVLLGAFYPAIDVTAGERERGTLETMLVAPIPRRQLLLGKVLAVTVLASASGFLNLASMSLTLVQVVNLAAPEADLPVPWTRAAATGLVVLPTAFLLAALFVAVGSLARTFKAAQNLLVPVYFLFFAPAMLGALGDLPLDAGLALVPGLNVSLLARDIALDRTSAGTTLLVLAATVGWGLIALAVAARYYVSERFLAVADDVEARARGPARHVRRDEPPTAPAALTVFGVCFVLLFFVFTPLQLRHRISGLLISQWVGLGGMALIYAVASRRTLRSALGLMPASHVAFAGALLMAAGGWVVANMVAQWVLPPPKEYLDQLRRVLLPEVLKDSLGASLLVFAVTPAVCEELIFRGIILRGLLTRVSPPAAIGMCAAMFAAFHFDVYRFVPTGLLGLMLSFIAWRSGSILPAIVAHGVNNAVIVSLGHAGLDRRIDALGGSAQILLLAGAATAVAGGAGLMLRTRPHKGPSAPAGPDRHSASL